MVSMGGIMLLPFRVLFVLALITLQLGCLLWFLFAAYEIRMYPIKDFGMIIHEFDPWFNYRAAEYLAANNLDKFFKWYDYMSWYPIGRPIGTTIFPGMQMTAVGIFEAMKHIGEVKYALPKLAIVKNVLSSFRQAGYSMIPYVPNTIGLSPMSVNDICCMMPPWFGSIATLFTGLLAYEITRSVNAGLMTAGIMAIIPAHLMRSVGGEFDNEAIAVAAISATFWLWLVSVRTPRTWPIGVLAGFSYIYMVAAWGGYIFVVNMIGVHAGILVVLGRFNSGVYKAYTLFYIIGTAGAVQIPVVGWQPLRSLEQVIPLLVFLGYQVLAFCDAQRRRRKMGTAEFVKFRITVVAFCLAAGFGLGVLLWPTGYFGPLSSRIRGLFVLHTKTGNPLVDSVAEHQPASSGMYASYLNLPLDYAWLGVLVSLWNRNNGVYFFALYGLIASHFSGKMSRLVIICGPIVSIACGIWCGFVLDQIVEPFLLLLGKKGYGHGSDLAAPAETKGKKDSGKETAKDKAKKDSGKEAAKPKPKKKNAGSPAAFVQEEWDEEERPGGMAAIKRRVKGAVSHGFEDYVVQYKQTRTYVDNNPVAVLSRCALSVFIIFHVVYVSPIPQKVSTFINHCDSIAQSLSNPQVMYNVPDRKGGQYLVDDYYQGYLWVDKNTPKEARVMAWWDYGYQITGIAKRTSIADGNTWNHEHIATLGRMLTSPEKRGWNAIRHLADYVLVWAGGQGDDLAKSPHLARIGNSVFPDHCGDDDPKCNKFGFYARDQPTPMMAKSILYKLVAHNVKKGVKANEDLFKEVHTTKHGLMRVYQVMNISEESRDWIADPKNRICDAPGSWYCVGQYPPALDKLIQKRRTFAQVEDFNKKGEKSAYTKMIEKEKEL